MHGVWDGMNEQESMKCLKDVINKELALVVPSLRDRFGERLVPIVRFGSRARGNAKEGRECDLLREKMGKDCVWRWRTLSGFEWAFAWEEA